MNVPMLCYSVASSSSLSNRVLRTSQRRDSSRPWGGGGGTKSCGLVSPPLIWASRALV